MGRERTILVANRLANSDGRLLVGVLQDEDLGQLNAEPGRVDDIVAFLLANAAATASIYRSDGADPRVVLIDPTGRGVPDLPSGLAARPPHAESSMPRSEWE